MPTIPSNRVHTPLPPCSPAIAPVVWGWRALRNRRAYPPDACTKLALPEVPGPNPTAWMPACAHGRGTWLPGDPAPCGPWCPWAVGRPRWACPKAGAFASARAPRRIWCKLCAGHAEPVAGHPVFCMALAPVDMRQGCNGLSPWVPTVLGAVPPAGHGFVFLNKRRNRLKLLTDDGSGLWLCAQRLKRRTFAPPAGAGPRQCLRPEELTLRPHRVERAVRRPWPRR